MNVARHYINKTVVKTCDLFTAPKAITITRLAVYKYDTAAKDDLIVFRNYDSTHYVDFFVGPSIGQRKYVVPAEFMPLSMDALDTMRVIMLADTDPIVVKMEYVYA